MQIEQFALALAQWTPILNTKFVLQTGICLALNDHSSFGHLISSNWKSESKKCQICKLFSFLSLNESGDVLFQL